MNESKSKFGKRAFFLGGLTLILFAGRYYILDLIEPAKSLGRQVGETALDIYNTIKQNDKIEWPSTKREIWSTILLILSFVSLIGTVYFSIESIFKDTNKWFAIFGILLAALGLLIFLIHVAFGIVDALMILALGSLIAVVLLNGGEIF
jgi:hypothetical protein